MSHEQIAIGLGIARSTLEKHFAHELSAGAYAKRLDALVGLFAAACRGSASAARAYLQREPE